MIIKVITIASKTLLQDFTINSTIFIHKFNHYIHIIVNYRYSKSLKTPRNTPRQTRSFFIYLQTSWSSLDVLILLLPNQVITFLKHRNIVLRVSLSSDVLYKVIDFWSVTITFLKFVLL